MIEMGLTSVAESYRVIKQFHFESGFAHRPQEELTFSDNTLIRWSPEESDVRLKMQSTGKYSSNPESVRQLLMIQTFPNIQETGAEIYLRIYDGSDDYWWDGAAWSVAGAGEWNTEAEINANIDTFPILPGRTFAITVNLRSVDSLNEVTPIVSEIRVLMLVYIDFIEDLVLRSLLPTLETGITALSNYAAIPSASSDVSEIDFGAYRKNTPYNITNVEQVYDLTNDPNLLTNIFSSYNPTTEIISLSPDLPAGARPLVLFRYTPEIIYITHQDYTEVGKLPAMIIQRIEVPVPSAYPTAAKEGIVNKTSGAAVVIENPLKITLQFRFHLLAASAVDQMRLITKSLQFFNETQFITSRGLDEKYRLYLDKEFRDLSNPGKSDERVAWTQFSIRDIYLPLISKDTYAVTKLSVNVSEPTPPKEDPILGGSRTVIYVHSHDHAAQWTRTIEIEE